MADDSHSIPFPDSATPEFVPDAEKSGDWQPIGDLARRIVDRARKQREKRDG
jgi:hypothetical protein